MKPCSHTHACMHTHIHKGESACSGNVKCSLVEMQLPPTMSSALSSAPWPCSPDTSQLHSTHLFDPAKGKQLRQTDKLCPKVPASCPCQPPFPSVCVFMWVYAMIEGGVQPSLSETQWEICTLSLLFFFPIWGNSQWRIQDRICSSS